MTVPGLLDPSSNPDGTVSNIRIGYFLFRITIGVNIFFHGFMRLLTGLSVWEVPTAAAFTDTYLPMPLVHLFLYTLPFVEVVLGTLMTLGLFTRWAMIGGAVMMLLLVYGNTARQEWGTVGNNMLYALYFWIMLALQHYDWLALDNRRSKASPSG
ncbi:MAG: DoxX family protein [Gammaproteobacteria bacterium]